MQHRAIVMINIEYSSKSQLSGLFPLPIANTQGFMYAPVCVLLDSHARHILRQTLCAFQGSGVRGVQSRLQVMIFCYCFNREGRGHFETDTYIFE